MDEARPVNTREGQTYAGSSLASRYASFVKLPHTLFALPFAGVGALLASYSYSNRVTVEKVLWIARMMPGIRARRCANCLQES